ncbi:hypothetical protein CU098_011957, partial [Rhizopus stolonifer]
LEAMLSQFNKVVSKDENDSLIEEDYYEDIILGTQRSPRYCIGDQDSTLRMIIDNTKMTKAGNNKVFEEYVGVMLDNKKAYYRDYPHCLAQILLKIGFHNQFVRFIHNFLFDNEIFIIMNGSLSDLVKQQRELRQGDSMPPALFNLAIEPFFLSIINNKNISGYSV